MPLGPSLFRCPQSVNDGIRPDLPFGSFELTVGTNGPNSRKGSGNLAERFVPFFGPHLLQLPPGVLIYTEQPVVNVPGYRQHFTDALPFPSPVTFGGVFI